MPTIQTVGGSRESIGAMHDRQQSAQLTKAHRGADIHMRTHTCICCPNLRKPRILVIAAVVAHPQNVKAPNKEKKASARLQCAWVQKQYMCTDAAAAAAAGASTPHTAGQPRALSLSYTRIHTHTRTHAHNIPRHRWS